jgi:hypothetical protein
MTDLNAFHRPIRYAHATGIDGVTSNLYTFCGLQYKRVLNHGSLHRERFSHFQISTEAYLGGMQPEYFGKISLHNMQIFVFGLPSPLSKY